MKDWSILAWIGFIILIGVLLVYSAGTVADTKAFGTAATGGIKALFGPGKYASGSATSNATGG